MTFFKRIRNLWELSNFSITEFDNKLVISRFNQKLTVHDYDTGERAEFIEPVSFKDKFKQAKTVSDLLDN